MENKIIKNFSFVFGAQSLILIINVIRALILPKCLSIEEFGYWEVYWFYSTYVGILCLGYTDGIYLKYGEYDYNNLPLKSIRSGNLLFIGMLVVFTIVCILLSLFFVSDDDIRFGIVFSALNILILGITNVFIYVYQITNLFKKYSFYSILDKILLFTSILVLFIGNLWNYRILILIDFFAKVFVLILLVIKSRELIFGELLDVKQAYHHFSDNIKIGIKLMIANLMSMLLIGAGKFIVQIFGNIKDFAVYSFGISITGLVLTMVVSVSLVLYPAVKRIQKERYSELFEIINSFNRLFGLSSLLLYFPIFIFVQLLYPKYNSVLVYLNILFVLIFLQCKISMLNNTFYKVLREEKQLLYANMSCVFLFVFLALICFSLKPAMWVIAACTCVAMFYRCYSSELFLNKKLSIKFSSRNYYEILFMTVFLLSTSLLSLLHSFVLISVVYIIWFVANLDSNKKMVTRFVSPKF